MKTQAKVKSKEINTVDDLPEVIDRDMGWQLMFGSPDEDTTRTSTNYDAVVSVPRLR